MQGPFVTHAGDPGVPADAALFRRVFRRAVGGISVITVAHDDERSGLTATSVVSLAPDASELLVTVNPGSSSFPLLLASRRFGVNLLSLAQRDVAERFSGRDGCRGEQRYSGAPWLRSEHGTWRLQGAPVAMDCTVQDLWIRPQYAVIIGRIERVWLESSDAELPLLYTNGCYGTFAMP